MILFLQILFWIAFGLLIHTYLLYPFILFLLSEGKSNNEIIFEKDDLLPKVLVFISAYNEEDVIEKKIKSLFTQSYPKNKVKIYVGSDNSSDNTNKIMEELDRNNESILFYNFKERSGKPGVINRLVDIAKRKEEDFDDNILLLTDANVILGKETMFNLLRHFKNKEIHIVDSNMITKIVSNEGIADSETSYIQREVRIKHREGLIWKKLMGTFGGCFAIRPESLVEVPSNFVVDDFFISMKVLEKNHGVISDLEARCYENASDDWNEEFRRKKRISSGNFQNLKEFSHLLNPFKLLGFIFISHKALRYIGPFLMLIMLITSLILSVLRVKYMIVFLFLLIGWFLIIPIVDVILKQLNFKVNLLRNIRYFNLMNLALLQGYKNYSHGIRSSTWEPTKRK